jgi:hypothetical protein
MDFRGIESYRPGSSKANVNVRRMEVNSERRVEITREQYDTIIGANMTKSADYAGLQRAVADWTRLLTGILNESSQVIGQLEEAKARKMDLERIKQAITENKATRQEKMVYEKAKDVFSEVDTLTKKDQQLAMDAERFRSKQLAAREALKTYTIGTMHGAHVTQVSFIKNTVTIMCICRRAYI